MTTATEGGLATERRGAWEGRLDRVAQRMAFPKPQAMGRLVRLVGLTWQVEGLQAPVGALCEVLPAGGGSPALEAEVVGFHGSTLDLMPLGESQGVGPGAWVRVVRQSPDVAVGPGLLGRVIDAQGRPLDEGPPLRLAHRQPLWGHALNPMERGAIDQVLDVGVKAINGLLTVGRGQRLGLMAGSGVGKSMLLGMLTRNTAADVVVIGLIGERGREVREFIRDILGPAGRARAVVVAAPAHEAAVMRLKATLHAHAIAEYFRDQGQHVLLLVDSLSRAAHAQREIGLALGEPPTSKGYPPSVFALLPTLIERGGVGRHGVGSITAFYTVLAEGDDAQDPIVDIARASLDGQVMLSRRLADAAHYPAIDLTGSISRVMHQVLPPQAVQLANRLRRYWSLYQQNAELIEVGAYQRGTNLELDTAWQIHDALKAFLQQDASEAVDCEHTWALMQSLAEGA